MYLSRLRINNFAIIKAIDVSFREGFSVITGETGAGKSIIIDALSLALGEKFSGDVVRTGEKLASVECYFAGVRDNLKVGDFISKNGLPNLGDELKLKREITSAGKTRSFINDRQVNLSVLRELGNIIVDLHGQHDHQALLYDENHIEYLDLYAGLKDRLVEVRDLFYKIARMEEELKLLKDRQRLFDEKKELWEFQLQEIEKVRPEPGEYEKLVEEKKILENAERVYQLSNEVNALIYDSDDSIFERLQVVEKKLQQLCEISSSFNDYLEEISNARFLLRELSERIAGFVSSIDFDRERLDSINSRLFVLQQLTKKYKGSIEEVLRYKDELKEKLGEDEGLDRKIEKLEEQLNRLRQEYLSRAIELSRKRKAAARDFGKKIEEILDRLGIKGARFEVKFGYIEQSNSPYKVGDNTIKAGPVGIDVLHFEISTNPGENLKPLSNIVSGGEVSRIMLAIKSILAGRDQIPVLIFDEIDTGISGRIARVVGEELKKLGFHHQVLCITHLPQIASLGDSHYKVMKYVEGGKTYTTIKELTSDERVREIAGLIGGKEITDTNVLQAKELLTEHREGKVHG